MKLAAVVTKFTATMFAGGGKQPMALKVGEVVLGDGNAGVVCPCE